MINWVRKYWWLVMLFFIAFPFLLNFAVTRSTPLGLDVAGEPKDWIMFWGAYISSIASAVMAFLTYLIIKQNNDLRKGELLFRIIEKKSMWFLEISNIGNGVVEDIHIDINNNFTKLLNRTTKENLESALTKRFCLKRDEDAKIFIEHSYIIARHDSSETDGYPIKTSDGYTRDEFEKIINTPIEITTTFRTLGELHKIKQVVIIKNLMLS